MTVLDVSNLQQTSKVSYKFETEKEKSDFELPEMDTLSQEQLIKYGHFISWLYSFQPTKK